MTTKILINATEKPKAIDSRRRNQVGQNIAPKGITAKQISGSLY